MQASQLASDPATGEISGHPRKLSIQFFLTFVRTVQVVITVRARGGCHTVSSIPFAPYYSLRRSSASQNPSAMLVSPVCVVLAFITSGIATASSSQGRLRLPSSAFAVPGTNASYDYIGNYHHLPTPFRPCLLGLNVFPFR